MYESFYNFSEPPFRLTPDPRFYFSSATHKRALTHLRFGFHQREGFVVITGKPGTGKTELMLHLLEGLPQDRISYGKIVTSNLDANEILQQVAAAFHIPAEGIKKGVLLKKLEDVFLQHVRENKRLVLIVDEAHKLSVNSLNELQMLTNFQLSGKAALQCFLSGHDNLKINLHDPELLHLKQRVITSTFLMPLEKQETQEYIEHRLRCVSWDGDPKFNLAAYGLIHDTTEGIPRQINALCNRVLLRAYSEQKHYIDQSMVSRAIDDASSEPLASNLSYPHVLSEIAGDDGFQDSTRRLSQHSPMKQFVGVQESATDEDVGDTLTYPYNDLDETLPLPSAVNGVAHPAAGDSAVRKTSWAMTDSDSTVLRGNQSATPNPILKSHGDPMNASVDERDQEIIDEARKMSDALSDFHSETASKASNLRIPPPHTGRKYQLVPDSQSARDFVAKRSADLNSQRKSRRTWAAPLTYGSVALFLLATGAFFWTDKFPDNIFDSIRSKGGMDETLVTAIKGLLPADEVERPARGDISGQAEHQSEGDPVTALANSNQGPDQSGMDLEQTSISTQDEIAQPDALTLIADAGSTEEQWDSGALGGQFLIQQTEQAHQPTEEQISASDIAAAGAARQAKPSTEDLPQSPSVEPRNQSVLSTPSQDKTKQQAKKSANNELAIAAVVSVPKISAPKETAPKKTAPKETTPQVQKPANTKSQSKPSNVTSNKQSAPNTVTAQPPPAESTEPAKAKTQAPATGAPREIATKTPAATEATVGVSIQKSDIVTPQVSIAKDAVSHPGTTNNRIDKTQLNELLARLTSAYENGNLNQLLSVLSNDVRSNDGATRRDLKNGYRKLFNITDMRKMTISSVNWSKKDRSIHGEGEFELFVREKGADSVTSYGGVISLEVAERAEGAVITRLNYDYKN